MKGSHFYIVMEVITLRPQRPPKPAGIVAGDEAAEPLPERRPLGPERRCKTAAAAAAESGGCLRPHLGRGGAAAAVLAVVPVPLGRAVVVAESALCGLVRCWLGPAVVVVVVRPRHSESPTARRPPPTAAAASTARARGRRHQLQVRRYTSPRLGGCLLRDGHGPGHGARPGALRLEQQLLATHIRMHIR